jgi:hypothetical protein
VASTPNDSHFLRHGYYGHLNPFYLYKVDILPSVPRLPKLSSPFRFSEETCVCICVFNYYCNPDFVLVLDFSLYRYA